MNTAPEVPKGAGASVLVRPAGEDEAGSICSIFGEVYGGDYPYKRFLDDDWLKRSIYNDEIITLVAEDKASKKIVGTASVVMDIGAQSDLLGEFGRLAVLDEAKGRGVGKALMARRLELCADRLHLAIVENRTAHQFSQRISQKADFKPVGFLPLKHQFSERESMAVYARHFGDALALRRNHPRVVPEVHTLAFIASENCGLGFDGIVDEDSSAYPADADFEVESLSAQGYPLLLRIERGRTRHREVFGPMRLHHGFFKLAARRADYIVARRPSRPGQPAPVAGAIGFTRSEIERSVRVFELIAASDTVVPQLFDALLASCQNEWNMAYVEVDVSAHAPRLQRTLLERGFIPAAFVPSMVFCDVERLDVIKMVRLLVPPPAQLPELTEPARAVAEPVISALRTQSVLPALAEAVDRLPIFSGLDPEQTTRVAASCRVANFAAGESLFGVGDDAEALHVILEGSVAILRGEPAREIASIGSGEVVGEHALMVEQPHTASARANTPVRSATLSRQSFRELSRRRPDIAVILYRNLSVGLGEKLRRMSG